MNAKELEQMRAEDRRYGEQQKGKPKQKERRKSNQVNFNRFSAKELAQMEDTDDFLNY